MELTVEEYNGLGFEGGDRADFPRKLADAQVVIDLLSGGRRGGALTAEEEKCLKQAIYAQCENMLLYGGEQAGGRVSIGDFSYDVTDYKGSSVEGIGVCPISLAILKLSGLFYRGTAVKDAC